MCHAKCCVLRAVCGSEKHRAAAVVPDAQLDGSRPLTLGSPNAAFRWEQAPVSVHFASGSALKGEVAPVLSFVQKL